MSWFKKHSKRIETIGSRLKEESIKDVLLMCSDKKNYSTEYLWVVSIKDNEIKGITKLGGDGHQVNFSYGDIIKRIRKDKANEFLLVHNHPSGDPRPSKADMNLILKLNELRCKNFDSQDFIIFSERYIWSYNYNMALLDGEIYPIFWDANYLK